MTRGRTKRIAGLPVDDDVVKSRIEKDIAGFWNRPQPPIVSERAVVRVSLESKVEVKFRPARDDVKRCLAKRDHARANVAAVVVSAAFAIRPAKAVEDENTLRPKRSVAGGKVAKQFGSRVQSAPRKILRGDDVGAGGSKERAVAGMVGRANVLRRPLQSRSWCAFGCGERKHVGIEVDAKRKMLVALGREGPRDGPGATKVFAESERRRARKRVAEDTVKEGDFECGREHSALVKAIARDSGQRRDRRTLAHELRREHVLARVDRPRRLGGEVATRVATVGEDLRLVPRAHIARLKTHK